MNKRIVSLENQKIETILNARLNEERRALENIRKNNKYFFKYANKFRKTPSSPNILLDEHDNPIISHKKIADALQDQFKGVFSIPKNDSDFDHSSFNNNKKPSVLDLPDLVITEKDVILAINEIKIDSKCPNYDIPAIIIKNCKYTLCKPLKLFYQKSFNTGIVPRKYKTQLIIPLFKKGIKTKAQNYRPISLTSHIIKIFERILRKYLTFYFEVNHFFNNNQHGFRSERSCSTQLLAHITHILTNSSNGHDTDCIYVDYAKAFDKIDHGLLLKKLHSYSIPKSYINWIKKFLMERTQTVYLNNNFSYPTPVMSGVPQGSVLGPLLFIIYINDMPDVICNSQILTFADDTKIVSKISTTDDTFNLQKDLDNLIEWSNLNNMKLNNQKFELLCHSLGSKNPDQNKRKKLFQELPFNSEFFSYNISNIINLYPSSHVKDLGVFVQSNLCWDIHIKNITTTARQVCAWILSVFYTRDQQTLLVLFNSLVRTKLEYCNVIWNPSLIKDIEKIESIQRSYTNKIFGMDKYNYWERLQKLNIMSLQRRRERNLIINVWKIKNDINPNDINLTFKENKRFGAIEAKLKPLPKLLTGKALTIYEDSFQINSAKLWNRLPGELTKISSLATFKTKLDNFLKNIPDQPPISGYPSPCITKNSIKNYCSSLNL